MRRPALIRRLEAVWLILASIALAHGSAPAQAATVRRARYAMGTLFTVRADGEDSTALAQAIEEAMNEVDRLEGVMSSWRPSELSRMNLGAQTRPVEVSRDLFAVIAAALSVARETDGAFDPTVEPLVRAWDLRGRGRVPSRAERVRARSLVDWSRVALDSARRTVSLGAEGTALDLGGIGKGYALDRAAWELRHQGVTRALLNLGGEILALGEATGGPWTVEVAHPDRRLVPAVRIRCRDRAVSTSSNGERGIVAGGRRYGHVLDPGTGRPLESRASVTVACASATRADALSTALLVMGRAEARRFTMDHPEIGVLWTEPVQGRTHAWAWNAPDLEALPGENVQWAERPRLDHDLVSGRKEKSDP